MADGDPGRIAAAAKVAVAAALLVLAALVLVGCAGDSGAPPEAADAVPPEAADAVPSEADDASQADDEGSGEPSGASSDAPVSATVFMMGRSVMAGWFQHWDPDWDWESPVERGGHSLVYRELSSPPDIADSARAHIGDAPPGSVVFFKFCFVDFGEESGGHPTADLERWVRQVADAAEDRGVTLVLGNALPQVAAHTDASLVEQHAEFGRRLEGFAEERGAEVLVLDLHGVLADERGALRSGYAVSPDDSHLTDAAYEALDPSLFETLAAAVR